MPNRTEFQCRDVKCPKDCVTGPALFQHGEWQNLVYQFRLSWRQQQILCRILGDETELKIARALGISAHTVHTLVARLHRKLEVSSRAGLIIRVVSLLAERVATANQKSLNTVQPFSVQPASKPTEPD